MFGKKDISEEQRLLAEELGISPEGIALSPKGEDLTLMTPGNRSTLLT